MEEEVYDIDNVQVQMAMVVKLQQIQRLELPTLRYQNLEDYMKQSWRHHKPKSLHEAVNEIWSVHASDIVRFMSKQALTDNAGSLAEYADLIGGK